MQNVQCWGGSRSVFGNQRNHVAHFKGSLSLSGVVLIFDPLPNYYPSHWNANPNPSPSPTPNPKPTNTREVIIWQGSELGKTRRNLWSLYNYCPHLHVGSRACSLTTHVRMTSSWSCWCLHLIAWRIPPHEALMKGFHLNDRDITAAQAPATNKRGENIFCYKCCRWSYVVFFLQYRSQLQGFYLLAKLDYLFRFVLHRPNFYIK